MTKKNKKIFALFLSCTITFTIFSLPLHTNAITLTNNSSLLSIDDLPSVIAEENITDFGHIQRLETTELDTIKFQNIDNSISVYKFSENVSYIDENGIIQDKSNALYRQADGSYKNIDNDVELSFGHTVSDGITLTYDDFYFEMTPYVERDISSQRISTESNLSEITVNYIPSQNRLSTNTIVYNEFFEPNDAIIYTPTFSGFKEDIILSEEPTTNHFSFIVNITGATLENKSSHIEIVNDDDIIGIINPIVVVSSNDLFSDGYYTVEDISLDNNDYSSYVITLVLDPLFLYSSDVKYPITIDPSVTISAVSNSTKQIYDATLYENQSSFATGTIQYNNVGYLTNDLYGHSRSIMKFPTLEDDLTFGIIPNNLLTSVYLYMYCVSATNSTSVKAYQYTGSSSWTESNVTSGLASTYNSSISAPARTISSGSSSSPTKYSFNITSIAKEWKSNRDLLDYGIILINNNESDIDYGVRFASSDTSSSYKPYLVYNYSQVTSFTLKSVYSDGFLNAVGSSNVSNYISDAMDFTNSVFSSTFGVSFTTSSPTARTSLIDQCPMVDVACTTSTCGSNCYTSHHRNASRYANEIYDLTTATNQIYIAWDYTAKGSICDSRTETHSISGAMALVQKMPDLADRGVHRPSTYYWDGMNVITAFQPWFNNSYKLSSMKLVAAHEMAHVLGIYDTYINTSLTDHALDSTSWTCIMRNFNHSATGALFVQDIEAGLADPFCEYCENLISTVVKLRYFPAS